MKKQTKKILGSVLFILSIVLVLGACFANFLPSELADFLFGGGSTLAIVGAGVAINPDVDGAGSPVSGTPTVESVDAANPDIHEIDLDPLIVKIKPTSAPIDTIIREMGASRKALAIETGGWEIGTREILDTVAEATVATVATSVVAIKVGKIQMWTKNSTFFVHKLAGGNGKFLGFFIYDIDFGASTIKCLCINPTGTAQAPIVPAIPIDSTIQRLGSAVNERTAQAIAYSILPTARTNYCQLFMTQVEEGVVESLQKKKVDIGFDVYKEQTLWDFRREIESAFLFGQKGMFINPIDQKPVYTCDGLWNQIDKNYELPTSITDNKYIEMTERIFADQNGSERKILFGGNGLLKDIMSAATYSKQLDAKNVEMKFGIKFNVIETTFGELLVRPHQLFTGTMANSGIVIDPSFIVKEYLEPLTIQALDLDKTGNSRVNAERLLENACPFVKNLPTHCKISRPIV